MDALTLLSNDHQAIDGLFNAYTSASGLTRKEELAQRMVHQLTAHAAVEELVVFRMTRERSPALRHHVDAGVQAHRDIARTLVDLEALLANLPREQREERMDLLVGELREQVRGHVERDYQMTFPAMRRALSAKELDTLGLAILEARPSAPLHPPPMTERSVIRLTDDSDESPKARPG